MSIGSILLGVEAAAYTHIAGATAALASAEFLGAETLPLADFYSEEVPKKGKEFKKLLGGYQVALKNKDKKGAKEVQKQMAALLSQTKSDAWSTIVRKLEATGWATKGGFFATTTRAQTLKRYGVEPNPFNLQLYECGLSVEGRSIAFDLDGTLIEYALESTATDGKYLMTVQIKAGAEALVLGLARNNELLLYTVRDAAQVAAIFDRSPAFQKTFANTFTLIDWISVMTEIVSKGLEHPEELTPFEQKILGLFRIYCRVPMSLTHLKHPEFARRQGKLDFEVIVDDSPGFRDLLTFMEADVKQISLRPRKPYKNSKDMQAIAEDEFLQIAHALRFLDEFQFMHIGHTEPLNEEFLQKFSLFIYDSSYLKPGMQHLESLQQRLLAINRE